MRFCAPLAFFAVAAAGGCAPSRALCPPQTSLSRHVYSGGGDAQWCRDPDGARQGPESRIYENGVESVSGEYVDGAQSGVWRYRFNDGRNWRAERWEDGALLAVAVDPEAARMTPAQLAAAGAMTSGVIKLAARDPASSAAGAVHAVVGHYPDGTPRVSGAYDVEGLRTGIWRFWHPNGRLAREMEFAAGVRDRFAREWHDNGAPAADGFYAAGVRDGRWRFWDRGGQLVREVIYPTAFASSGVASPDGPGTGMLPAAP